MAKRRRTSTVRKKPATTTTRKRRSKNNKWKSFFKYFAVVVVSSAVAILLFINRHDISKQLSESKLLVKEKVFNEKPKLKKTKKKTAIGYDESDRAGLDALIEEETK